MKHSSSTRSFALWLAVFALAGCSDGGGGGIGAGIGTGIGGGGVSIGTSIFTTGANKTGRGLAIYVAPEGR